MNQTVREQTTYILLALIILDFCLLYTLMVLL